MRAYVAYRNATGGVCGRQLVLKTGDDGFENGRYRALDHRHGTQVLGIAGGFAGGRRRRRRRRRRRASIPVVVDRDRRQRSRPRRRCSTSTRPSPTSTPIGKYRYLYEQGVRTAALVYIDQAPVVKTQVNQQRAQMEAAGIQVVHDQALPLSTLSYDAAARASPTARPTTSSSRRPAT